MTIQECRFETVHYTTRGIMKHIFSDRLEMMVDFKDYEVIVIKDGEVVVRESYMGESLLLEDYERLLIQAEVASRKLEGFTNH